MPKRIEHKIENGIELKWCAKCERWLELEAFHTTNNRTWDNRFYCCVDCYNKKRLNDPSFNAANTYKNMIDRCKNDPGYKNIQTKVTKKDFIKWYTARWFKGCQIDRKDNSGDYEIGNMQLISRKEHNYKSRQDNLDARGVVEPEGKRFCYACERLRPNKEFYHRKRKVSKINPLGLSETCKDCERKQRKKRYKETHK